MTRKYTLLDGDAFVARCGPIWEQGLAVPLTVTGFSMTPFLVHGRDQVYLEPLRRPARRGDILFYRRDNGQYVLHRVCGRDDRGYRMVGDAQTAVETGVCPEQIIAVATGALRKEHYQGPGTFWWEFFAHAWLFLRPVRPALQRLYGLTRRKSR